MVFSSYEAFRVAVQWLIEGDEVTGTFSVNVLDLMIGLGEARVYHGDAMTPGLRASTMVKPLSVAVSANAAALPSDLLELKQVYFSGEKPLEMIPLDRLREYEAIGGSGDVRYAAQDGDTLRFFPAATGTLIGSYYGKPEALETVTWANATTFARYPELFVFATLVESAAFLGMDARIPVWEAKYRQLASGAAHDERMRAYSGSRLRQRAA